jgi:phosphate transport system substrate-binding protein
LIHLNDWQGRMSGLRLVVGLTWVGLVIVSSLLTVTKVVAQDGPSPPTKETAVPPLPTPHRHELHFEIMRLLDQLEPYEPPENVSGSIEWHGSKTMQELAERISIRFRRFHPAATLEITTEGSETGLELLKTNPEIFVGVSRMVRDTDATMLREGGCKEPAMVVVGLEAMGIFVHKDNPLPSVGQEQVQAIFAAHSDGKPAAKRWGDLGVTGPYADQPIVTYEREVTSGSQSFLLEMLEQGSRLAPPNHECENNHEICAAVAKDRNGIGLAGLLNARPEELRIVPLVVNGEWVEPTEENVLGGRYPLMRPLFLVFDKSTKFEDTSIRGDLIRFLLSRDGQLAVMNSGFYPLQAGFVQHQLSNIFGPRLR